MSKSSRYEQRGVSPSKEEVMAAIRFLDKGLYPKAFCRILPDLVGSDDAFCNIMHADTAGTKPSLAYLYWKETGKREIWKGIAQDALVMNLDDLACVGCTDRFVLSSTIGRNKHLIPGEIIETLIGGTVDFMESMANYGIELFHAGGETADVGDIVRTLDVGFSIFARMPRKDLIINQIKPGNVIIGLASFGQTSYEKTYNSGIGSNGLTNARHDVLSATYREWFPESFDPAIPSELAYSGSKKLTDSITIDGDDHVIGELLLSPTRIYLPVLKQVLKEFKDSVHGLVHCTGGGQTKVLKFIPKVVVMKDNLFEVPPVFKLIQQESGSSWKEMYQVFNMGHRMEIYTDRDVAESIIRICENFALEAQVIGEVVAAPKKEVVIRSAEYGEFVYQ